jgi:type I restriction enzyme M protein
MPNGSAAIAQKLWNYCDVLRDAGLSYGDYIEQLKRGDLDDFVACYNAANRFERKESERFHSFQYEDLVKRDKANLDIFWLKDESLEDSANLPDPDVIAAEIAEDLQAALDQFSQIATDLGK